MAMEKSKKTKIIKLVSATSMVIFSLFVSISGAFAWFAGVRNVNNNSEDFYVKSVDSSIIGVSIHEFYGESGTDILPIKTEVDHEESNEIPAYSLPANTKYIHIATTALDVNEITFAIGGNNCVYTSAVGINSTVISAGATNYIIDLCASSLIDEEDLGNSHTLTVSYTNSTNDFSITIAAYDEKATSFAFNPVGKQIYDNETGAFNTGENYAVSLNPYFVEKPHHPVLILYKVAGYRTRIDLETDYCYLGNDTDFIVAKFATKALLDTAEAAGNLDAGSYYEVINDVNFSNKPALYRMDESISCVTYDHFGIDEDNIEATYIDSDAIKVNANDGRYFRVQEDENHGNVSSIYQYHKSSKTFELVWLDLGNSDESKTNPLSSVVDFYSLEFVEESASAMATTTYVARETYNDQQQDYNYNNGYLSCISITQSSLNDDNISSFTNFSDAETYDYEKTISVYDRDTTNYNYIGIVVDYDQIALEYIFSQNIGHDALNAGLVFVCDWITKF